MSNDTSQFGKIAAGDDIKSGNAKYDAGKPEVFQGVLDYFPRALMEVANVSGYGAKKYSWGGAKGVKGAYERYSNAMGRHQLLAGIDGPYDIGPGGSGLLHDAQVAWNALFKLEVGLRDGLYKSTRGNPLPDKAEAKPVDPVAVAAQSKDFTDFEVAIEGTKPRTTDAEMAEFLGGLLSSIMGENVIVVTDPREVYRLSGSWPPGYSPTKTDRMWAVEYDIFGGSQFEVTEAGQRELANTAPATINRLKPLVAAKARKKAPAAKAKRAAPKSARKR